MGAATARVLVIGAGSIGTRHMQVAHEMGYRVMGCDVDERAFDGVRQSVPGVELYTRLEEALDRNPEYVVVATAPVLHEAHTTAALRAGAHVLCEKPMADSVKACDAMIDAARQSGRVLHIGFTNRYNPLVLEARRLTMEGELGLPLFASTEVGSYQTLMFSRSRHQARTYAALLLDYTHQLDYIPWIVASPVRRVYARGANRGAFELKSNPNMIAMVLEHESGLVSVIQVDFVRHPQTASLSVTGDAGYVLVDQMTRRVSVGRRRDGTLTTREIVFERNDLFKDQLRNFVAAARGEAGRIVTGEEGRMSMLVVEAAIESMRTGQAVAVGGDVK